jgi:ABC-2 type transport system permease protein
MPFLMAAARTCVYLALAALLLHLDLSRADWPGVAAVLAASGLALSSLGIASAAMVLVVKRGDVIAAFGSFAIGILSGAVFPLSVLPDWLEPIGRALPTRFAFQGLRQALFGSGSWGGEVLVLLVYAVVLLPAALWAFSAALRVAKRAGSVAEY